MNRMIRIKGEEYEFISDYKANQQLRASFNLLTQQTYGFDFEDWFQSGYWGEKYIPYSLLKDNKVVANASVNVIDFSVVQNDDSDFQNNSSTLQHDISVSQNAPSVSQNNHYNLHNNLSLQKPQRYLQIGTVMTDQEHRNLGLSRYLMELILEEWEPKCDLIYLFANDSVLEFYPKFGFTAIREYEYSKSAPFNNTVKDIRKLDMQTKADQELLYDLVSHTAVLSKVSMLGNPDLVLFYCTSFMSDHVFYINEYQAVVIAEFEEGICYLQDVFCKKGIALDDIVAAIIKEDTTKVVFGFTPVQTSAYQVDLVANDIDVLFVKPDLADFFKTHQLRFPVLSHA